MADHAHVSLEPQPRQHICNVRLVDPQQGELAARDLYLAQGQIVGIGQAPLGFTAQTKLDAQGQVLAPGLVDICARLGEPGLEHEQWLASELRAAVHGGITTVVCLPDTDPVLDEPGLVRTLGARSDAMQLARVRLLGALTRSLQGEALAEMAELVDAGCVALSQADVPVRHAQTLLRAMQYAATFDFKVALRPCDAQLGGQGVAAAGLVATRLGLPAVPRSAETLAVTALLELARIGGCALHLSKLSCAESVELVAAAKAQGQRVTCDVALHHLHFCDEDIAWFNSSARLEPPLRQRHDREALREGLRRGVIDALCSDHATLSVEDKLLPFAQSSAGATGLELLLPSVLDLVQPGFALHQALALVTTRAAAVYALPVPSLQIGTQADLVLFDPDERWQVSPATLRSQCHATLFQGQTVRGRVKQTWVQGRPTL